MSPTDAASVARVFGVFPIVFGLLFVLIAYIGGRVVALQFPAGVPPRWVATLLALIAGFLLTYAASVGVFKLAQLWASIITLPSAREQIWALEFRMGPWQIISFVINTLVFDVSINHKRPKSPKRDTNGDIAFTDGLSALMIAAGDGDLMRLEELLASGSDVNVRSGIGTTALMYAAKNGHAKVVEALLAAGANVNVISEKGSTAWHLAEKSHHFAIVRLLTSHRSQSAVS
ncbi:MAG: ankyrin repeat domain-containing protein [Burkholderiales bacterium]|nr:ankyrin repeat domain-containing protein [Burkholderiales bacterium]